MPAATLTRQDASRKAPPQKLAREVGGIAIYDFNTQLGWMALAAKEDLICGISFGHEDAPAAIRRIERIVGKSANQVAPVRNASTEIRNAVEKLVAYADRERVDFREVRLSTLHLTPFGAIVTRYCREITWGATVSYRDLATKCGHPGAARAVGNVMRNNRFPIIVPCHRVLASGGGLGGYSAPQGLTMKRRLLDLETDD